MKHPSYILVRLVEARDLIEKGWTRKAGARNRLGEPCDIYSADAREFCILGAINRVCNHKEEPHSGDEVKSLIRSLLPDRFRYYYCSGFRGLFNFNDDLDTTKDMVLDIFDKAITKTKEELLYETP